MCVCTRLHAHLGEFHFIQSISVSMAQVFSSEIEGGREKEVLRRQKLFRL